MRPGEAVDDVEVMYGDNASDTATLLLAAAEELGLDPWVVKAGEGRFHVPPSVALKAAESLVADEPEPVAETPVPAKPTPAAKK